jgi:large subunit ribosomal protein L24
MGITRKRHEGGAFHPHVRKGDEVLVLAGRSLGERGRVVSVDPQRERAVVEGANLITKHQRSQGMGRNPAAAARQQSGRIQKPGPIHLSNLMVICPSCSKPTRIAHRELEGRRVRACKHCNSSLERSQESS